MRTTASAESVAKENPSSIQAAQSMLHAKLIRPRLSPLRRREHDIILDEMSGYRDYAGVYSTGAICFAAFGFVAFVVLFVRPAAESRRAAVQQAHVGSDVTAGTASAGARLAAPK
jgi:hypothetical protein